MQSKNAIRRAFDLWQSNNQNFVNMFFGAKFFFFFSIICFFLQNTLNIDGDILSYIATLTFGYLSKFFFAIALLYWVWGIYVNNSIKYKCAKYILFSACVIITIYSLFVGLLFLFIFLIIGMLLKARAKKLDNWINTLMILLILFGGLLLLLYPNIKLGIWATQLIGCYLEKKFKINLALFPCILFSVITVSIIISHLICFLLLVIMKRKQEKYKKKQLKNFENKIRGDVKELNNIQEYVDKKKNVLNQKEKDIDESNRRDIEYIQNSIKRIFFILLVIVFIILSFDLIPIDIKIFDEYRSDTINVLTIYTLILTYLDKRKEWK